MASVTQIRGMLLEEVVLHLLRASGYETVEEKGSDPTLENGHSGLEVNGRGERHQIDAVADFLIPQPFGYPNRLLVEAKFKHVRTGIEVVRNAVGVIKDVSEFFAPARGNDRVYARRYHYQMAIVSASQFTSGAQRYAFAQDIDLIQLHSSPYFIPVREAIANVTERDAERLTNIAVQRPMKELRRRFRSALRHGAMILDDELGPVVVAARAINAAYLAIADRRQRLFLVPEHPNLITTLPDLLDVRIFRDGAIWSIRDAEGRQLFSFELPDEITNLYAEQGRLNPERTLQIKGDLLNEILLYAVQDGNFRVIRLLMDRDWYQAVQEAPRDRAPDEV